MNILTLVTFAVSYIVWLAAWVHFGEWQPRRNPFIVADVLYATGTVMAFQSFLYVFLEKCVVGILVSILLSIAMYCALLLWIITIINCAR